ncbi:hypothetical protein [Bacillus cereus group sp. BY105LC]
MEAWLNDCDGVFQNKGEEKPNEISWIFLEFRNRFFFIINVL